mgnify:CR=1 FL=1
MDEPQNQLIQLGRYGLVGVFLALIILAGYGMWSVNSLSGKSIDAISENTKAITEMTSLLQGLRGSLTIKR